MKLPYRRLLILLALAGAAATASCVVSGRAFVTAEPQLVAVSPGVWVVGDYHEPVFFHSNMYWRYHSGVWYRSSAHNHGWVLVHNQHVPRAVIHIDRPRSYVHYRARPGVQVRRGPRGPVRSYQPQGRGRAAPRRAAPPQTRDHRAKPNTRDHRSAPTTRDHRPSPKTRDHRDKKKDKPKRKDWR